MASMVCSGSDCGTTVPAVAIVASRTLLHEHAGESPTHASRSLFYFLVIALIVQCSCWTALFVGLRRGATPPRQGETAAPVPPISLIVAARNESERIPALMEALRRQTHTDAELILVDDGSTDETPDLLASWSRRLSNLRVARRVHDADGRSKKRALQTGISMASHELLAFTDADCTPPPQWLEVLARHHAAYDHPTVLVGYSPFRAVPGSLLNHLARYETFVTGVLTAGTTGLGLPYMAVGRNLSYPRAVFEDVDGFASIMHSMSGDDDLFVQTVVLREAADVRAVLDPSTHVPTDAPLTWRAWLRQKRRHASAGRHYPLRVQAALAFFHGTSVALWLAPLLLGWSGAALLAVLVAAQFAVLRQAATLLCEESLMSFQPFIEPLYQFYTAVAAPVAMLFAPRRW